MTTRRDFFAVLAGVAGAAALIAPATAATIEMQGGTPTTPADATSSPRTRSAPNPTAMEPARSVRRSRRRRMHRRTRRRMRRAM